MRGLALLIFIGAAGFIAWTLADGGLKFGGAEEGTELGLAEEHDRALRSLDEVAEDALDNARRAETLAAELEEAAARARRTADEVVVLANDNEAAYPSAEAAELAAADAAAAAELMQAYADRMETRFERTTGLSNEAEEIAGMVETVEATQAEAERAARKAREAREQMRAAEANGELDTVEAGFAPVMPEPAPARRPARGEIVILDDEDDPIDVVREREEEEGDADIQRRLEEILPEDVLDDAADDTPYGERG